MPELRACKVSEFGGPGQRWEKINFTQSLSPRLNVTYILYDVDPLLVFFFSCNGRSRYWYASTRSYTYYSSRRYTVDKKIRYQYPISNAK